MAFARGEVDVVLADVLDEELEWVRVLAAWGKIRVVLVHENDSAGEIFRSEGVTDSLWEFSVAVWLDEGDKSFEISVLGIMFEYADGLGLNFHGRMPQGVGRLGMVALTSGDIWPWRPASVGVLVGAKELSPSCGRWAV